MTLITPTVIGGKEVHTCTAVPDPDIILCSVIQFFSQKLLVIAHKTTDRTLAFCFGWFLHNVTHYLTACLLSMQGA